MRDAQRRKLYAAEGVLRDVLDRGARDGTPLALERRWGTLGAVQDYVDSVTGALGAAPVEVVERHPRHRFSTMDRRHHRMNLIMSWGARELVVLHELGHYVTFATLPSHGPHFAQAVIDLVEQFSLGGGVLAAQLQEVYDRGGVAYGRRAANALALRELRNVINGIRGEGMAQLIFEAPQDTFQVEWKSIRTLRAGAPVDRAHLVAIAVHRGA